MSIVKPFKGLRPKPEFAKDIASPPYDVLTVGEARDIVKNSPNSFLRVNKAELEFDDSTDPYSTEVYQRSKDNLKKFIEDGFLIQDTKPCFYLYRLTMNNRSQTGLVALASIEEYDQGKIKKHEHTQPEKVNDRANHMAYLRAQVGPVFSTFRYNDQIDRIFKKIITNPAATNFVADDNVRHEFWIVDDDEIIRDFTFAFSQLKYFYIADGHHRSQSASEVCRRFKKENPNHTGNESYNFFLNVIFPDKELNILPYNRVVNIKNEITIKQILNAATENFAIISFNQMITPSQPHTFGLYAENKWYLLIAQEGSYDPESPTGSIDAAILNNNFLSPILGITNPNDDKRVDFVGGIHGTKRLVKLVNSGAYKIAFSIYPTSIEQLLRVADAGEFMPPKSTWFEPKLRSGMIINLFNDKA